MTWNCASEQNINLPSGRYCVYSYVCDNKTHIMDVFDKISNWCGENGVYNLTDFFQTDISDMELFTIIVRIPLLYKLAFEEFAIMLPEMVE